MFGDWLLEVSFNHSSLGYRAMPYLAMSPKITGRASAVIGRA